MGQKKCSKSTGNTCICLQKRWGTDKKITPAAQEQPIPKIPIINLIKYLLINKCTAIMDPILIKRKMIHDKKRKEKIMPREKNTVGYSIQGKCLHLACTQEKQTNLSCNFFFPFSSLLPQTGNVKKVLDTELPYHQCLRIGFYGLDLNSCPIHDFADYKFSIQSNPIHGLMKFNLNLIHTSVDRMRI